MTLQRKTLLIIGVTLVCLFAAMFLVARIVLLHGFDAYEMTRALHETELIRRAYLTRLEQMDLNLQQISAWDDMAAYADDPDPAFEHSNFPDSVFDSLGLNVLVVLDSEGNIVFARGYDLLERREQPISEGFLRALESVRQLRTHEVPQSVLAGLLALPENPMLIASRPIVSSDFAGPIRGTVIMGRYADETLAARSGAFLERQVTALDWDATPARIRTELADGTGVFAEPIDDFRAVTYARLDDVRGAPALTLRAELPLRVHDAKVITGRTLFLSVLIAGLVFGAMVMLLIRQSVLSRVASLESEVGGIAESGDARRRVVLRGSDELTSLAGSVNGMLEALEASREALRHSEETSRALMNATMDSAFLVSRDATVLAVNDTGARRLGMSRDEVIGANFRDLFPASLAESRMAKIHEAFDTGQPVRFEDQRGDTYFDVTLYPVANAEGHVERLAMFAHDITEIRRAEQALRESRARYRQLVQGVNSVVLRWDPEGRITFMNEYGQQFFGWTWEELAGRLVTETIVPETDASGTDLRAMVADVLRHPEKYITQENENIRESGERVWMSWSNRPIFDDDGNLTEILSIGNDISRRRRAEQALVRRVQMEELVASVSSRFLSVAPGELDEAVREVLGSVAQFVGADRAYIYFIREDRSTADMTHEWYAEGIPSFQVQNIGMAADAYPWYAGVLASEGVVNISDIEALPEEAAPEQAFLRGLGVHSLLDVPMFWRGEILGLLGFSALGRTVSWAEDDIRLLKVVAGILVAAFQRARAEDAVMLQNRRLEALLELQDMTDASPRVMTAAMLRKAVELTRSAFGVIGVFDPATGAFQAEHWVSDDDEAEESPPEHLARVLADPAFWETVRRLRKPTALRHEMLPPDCRYVLERFLAVPILEGDRVVAVAAVANKTSDYEDADISQLQLLMTGAWNQIRRIESAAWIQREIDEIANIQRTLLPETLPAVRGMRVRAFSSTFDRAGGDYYDVLPVGRPPGAPLKDHPHWLVLVADASGHGPSAAVVVAMLSTLLRTRCAESAPPAQILGYLNDHLRERTVGQSFVTAFIGFVDLESRTLTYSNAGQNPPLLRTSGGAVTELETTGDVPLSVLDGWSYSERSIAIPAGAALWLYTDGVVETLSPQGEAFGAQRLCDAISHLEGSSSRAIAEVVGMLRAHEAGRRPSDDQVIMLVEFA